MITNFLHKILGLNDFLFGGIDRLIEGTGFPDWVCDALIDSIHTLPFLFIVFVFIELFEYYYADKVNNFMKNSGKTGPLIGSLAAIIPQCGFSIIASSLYTNKLITRGTLIAIYLATSDEALPVLLSYPEKIHLVLPVIGVKLVIAIIAGYLTDLFFKSVIDKNAEIEIPEEGCCKHDILTDNKINLWLHPVMHTLNVFAFILIITLILNFFIKDAIIINFLNNPDLAHKFLQPVITSAIGLIPNCAVSIALTMMLIKGTITFGAAIAGLCSNAGLGLLVLLRKNSSLKDSVYIILLLLLISILSGIILECISNTITGKIF